MCQVSCVGWIMPKYKILLTAERAQRQGALDTMKAKIKWTRPFKNEDFVLHAENAVGGYLIGCKQWIGIADPIDPELSEFEELEVQP